MTQIEYHAFPAIVERHDYAQLNRQVVTALQQGERFYVIEVFSGKNRVGFQTLKQLLVVMESGQIKIPYRLLEVVAQQFFMCDPEFEVTSEEDWNRSQSVDNFYSYSNFKNWLKFRYGNQLVGFFILRNTRIHAFRLHLLANSGLPLTVSTLADWNMTTDSAQGAINEIMVSQTDGAWSCGIHYLLSQAGIRHKNPFESVEAVIELLRYLYPKSDITHWQLPNDKPVEIGQEVLALFDPNKGGRPIETKMIVTNARYQREFNQKGFWLVTVAFPDSDPNNRQTFRLRFFRDTIMEPYFYEIARRNHYYGAAVFVPQKKSS